MRALAPVTGAQKKSKTHLDTVSQTKREEVNVFLLEDLERTGPASVPAGEILPQLTARRACPPTPGQPNPTRARRDQAATAIQPGRQPRGTSKRTPKKKKNRTASQRTKNGSAAALRGRPRARGGRALRRVADARPADARRRRDDELRGAGRRRRAEILPFGPGVARGFERRAYACRRCKNERERRSYGRGTGRNRTFEIRFKIRRLRAPQRVPEADTQASTSWCGGRATTSLSESTRSIYTYTTRRSSRRKAPPRRTRRRCWKRSSADYGRRDLTARCWRYPL